MTSREKKEERLYVGVLAVIVLATIFGPALLGGSHHYIWMVVAFLVGCLAFLVWTLRNT